MNYFVEMAYIDLRADGFDSNSRSFTFADPAGTTTIRFETPDRFTIKTVAAGNTVESYTFTRS